MGREGTDKSAFWKALVFTVIIFGIGLLLGVYLESSRGDTVEKNIMNSEISLLDEQVRNNAIGEMNVSCAVAKESTFNFADRIYAEAMKLEQYDAAAKFLDTLTVLHRRYDLMRMMVWSEGIGIKKKCGNDFHTIVYLYDYKSEDTNRRAMQSSVSNVLADLKARHPNEILLIPIAANLDLDSVDVAKKNYGIVESPAVIIDENVTMGGLVTVEEIENVIFKT